MAPRRDINWDKVPLGWVPDKTLAVKLGCRQQSVWAARRKRKIPSYQERVRFILRAVAGNRAGKLLAKDAKRLLKGWLDRGGATGG